MFQNKKDRMRVYLAVPTLIIGFILIYYGELNYQYFALLVFWTIFYLWRFFTKGNRRKKKKILLKLTE
ncbi:hypothetical protein PB01_14580 [Psychrobacillus glaciei]|uniref:Uncharacterized protein n=1 Tax=Psychrobacillus glaciei TaxID=2283160 RepID=A0A5J6SQM2_9BACI|nr:hypothetical protein [Psychrobacillus glaciei]QFF99949.1 hypothetical protein PB01_14580 [Psychrobacillus glaciei]